MLILYKILLRVSSQDSTAALGKAYLHCLVLQKPPQCCPLNFTNVGLVVRRLFPALEDEMLAASFSFSLPSDSKLLL